MPGAYGSLLLASCLFSIAILFGRNAYTNEAMIFIVMADGLLLSCFFGSLRNARRAPFSLSVGSLPWVGLFGMAWYAFNDHLLMYRPEPWVFGRWMQGVMLGLLLTYLPFLGGGLRDPTWLRWARMLGFAAAVVAGGVDAIHTSANPGIDVWQIQQTATRVLSEFTNPYPVVKEPDTGPTGGLVGYTYPPTQILLTLPAYVWGHDVRYAMLAAVVIAGLCIRHIAGHGRSNTLSIVTDAPALCVWLAPKLFFIIELAWIDPIQLMLLSLVVVAHIHRRRWLTAILLGVTLTSKQSMFWAVAVVGLGLRFDKKQWAAVLCTALALVGPFMLLDFGALKAATWDIFKTVQTRHDSLSFLNWCSIAFDLRLPTSSGFVLAAAVTAAAVLTKHRSLTRIGIGLATAYALFFSFAQWAFPNYYFFLTGLCALAAALVDPPRCHQ